MHDGSRAWTLEGIATAPPGDYHAELVLADDDGGAATQRIDISILPEDAAVQYSGLLQHSTRSRKSGRVTLVLRAAVNDISSVPSSPLHDPHPGDVATATVRFEIRDPATGALIDQVTDVPVRPDGVSRGAGSAVAHWAGDIGVASIRTLSITAIAGGNYQGAAQPRVITVSRPSPSTNVGGAGSLTAAQTSAGALAPDPGQRIHFSFSAHHSANGLTGHASILFRRTGPDGRLHTYLARANALLNAGSDHRTGIGGLEAFATLTDITNPARPQVLSTSVRMQLQFTVASRRNRIDSLAITLWEAATGALLLAPAWQSPRSIELPLSSGNLRAR